MTADQLAAGSLSASYNINLCTGFDVAESAYQASSGTIDASGSIDGRAGEDQLKYNAEGSESLNLTFDGGNDNDLVDVFAKGMVTGNPALLG
jgi:hypothetical protein